MIKWSEVALGEVATVFNGKTPSKSEQRESGFPVLKIRDVDEHGKFRGSFGSYVDLDFVDRYKQKTVKPGDSFVLNAAHSATHVASKLYFAEKDTHGAQITGEWLVIRPSDAVADPRFLHNWIGLSSTRHKLSLLVKGIHLYPRDVARLPIPLPPLEEQRRIAAILDKADELRSKRREAIAKLDTLAQSIFIDMFGDPVTNPMGWQSEGLGDVCDVRDGTHDSPKYVSDSGFPLVTSKNIKKGKIDLSDASFISHDDYEKANKRSKVHQGDIIMPMIGTIGNPCLIDFEPRFAIKNVALFKFDNCSLDSRYTHTLLSGPFFKYQVKRQSRGGTQAFVSLKILRGMTVPLPPRDLQVQFRYRITEVDHMRSTLVEHLNEAENLFGSLQQRAFKGEL